jgi:hypothetical protein
MRPNPAPTNKKPNPALSHKAPSADKLYYDRDTEEPTLMETADPMAMSMQYFFFV